MAVHIWHNISISDANYKVGVTSQNEMKVLARVTDQPVAVAQSGTWSVNQAGLWTFTPNPIASVTSLNAATSTGAGSALDAGQIIPAATMYVSTTGGPTFDVELQVSLDGSNWFDSGAAITVSGTTALASTHARYYRANLTALTGGTSPTVTVHIAASY